ncbi:hypothetical protein F7734_10300 [Scytonema sp. UIC 10036]|uniref:hypothetical protein n=1 Tax=Scytonema sp. UIC 10036 TaxID=2304196 RepID=UPI0012DAB16A|nr:hypothetical protein [Scytonema sp. UIC 10036]MUG92819.1 hypothetical protein [Scytonema sp. UIC 10036]
MGSLTSALQPFLNWMSLINIVVLIIFLGIGVKAAFFLRSFVYFILAPVCLILFASTFSNLLPEMYPGVINYIWTLALGFVMGKVVYWISRQLF